MTPELNSMVWDFIKKGVYGRAFKKNSLGSGEKVNEMEIPEKIKLTVEFNKDMTYMIKVLAKENQTTQADIIRRSLLLYYYLDKEIKGKKDRKLSISTDDDRIIKDIIY